MKRFVFKECPNTEWEISYFFDFEIYFKIFLNGHRKTKNFLKKCLKVYCLARIHSYAYFILTYIHDKEYLKRAINRFGLKKISYFSGPNCMQGSPHNVIKSMLDTHKRGTPSACFHSKFYIHVKIVIS